MAQGLQNLAEVYRFQGRYDLIEPLYKRALAISTKVLGSEHRDVASSLESLALLYHIQGKYAEAERLYRQALAIREKALRTEPSDKLHTLNCLGELLTLQGKVRRGRALVSAGSSLREKVLGPNHPVRARLHAQQPGGALHAPGQVCRGRGASEPGRRDPAKGAWT